MCVTKIRLPNSQKSTLDRVLIFSKHASSLNYCLIRMAMSQELHFDRCTYVFSLFCTKL